MNKTFVAVVVVIVVGGGFFLFQKNQSSGTPPPAAPLPPTADSGNGESNVVVVTMKDSGYAPDRLTIKQGDTVQFDNAGMDDRWPASNIHPTHSIFPEFDPKRPIPRDQSWSFTFDTIGIWRMHDHLDPTIVGVVTVEE